MNRTFAYKIHGQGRWVAFLSVSVIALIGAAACRPGPTNWQYNSVRQAVSSSTFGAHNVVEYRFNGRRIEVRKSSCAADNWYSGLRYTGSCTARVRNGRLEVRWGWVWVKGSPPTARSQSYACHYNVTVSGKITRLRPNLFELPCSKFSP
jgi:hypothetical protein